MNMIKNITRIVELLNPIKYFIKIPPRPSNVPTHGPTLMPFTAQYLSDNPGARRFRKIFGRGRASGKGKTCGRGIKGQNSRSGGGVHVRFEGGQTPLQKRLPKYGRIKKNRAFELLDYINLEKIDYFVKRGIINASEKITIKTLVDTGLVKKVKFGVKILARGAQKINYPLHLEVSDASVTAIKQIQKAGGRVELVFRTPLKLRQHIYPQKYPLPLRDPITPFWRVQKLQRLEESKGLPIAYKKPKWMLEEQEALKKQQKSSFIYPVPIVQNSGKIRKRKPKVYRKISYNLP